MMKTVCLGALFVVAVATAATAVSTSDLSYVVIGSAAIESQMAEFPTLEQPTILMELDSEAEVEGMADVEATLEEALMSPMIAREVERINVATADLANVELLAHQMGAPVFSEIATDRNELEVSHIEQSLLSADSHSAPRSNVRMLAEDEHFAEAAMLEAEGASFANLEPEMTRHEAEVAAMEREVNMVELGVEVQPARKARAALDKKNDYAYLDDPVSGGQPTSLKNLRGIDIYVVNTPIRDNDNEIRPVKPPHPMSAASREKARLAAIMRKQLIHDVPQPRATVKPKTRINTLSAYESSLGIVRQRPLRRISRFSPNGRALEDPMVGGHGALQMHNAKSGRGAPRFQQVHNGNAGMPSARSLPHFPKDPTAGPEVVRAFGAQSSFDNRDGPPALLDDMLPIKATLVEDLDPLRLSPPESKPVW